MKIQVIMVALGCSFIMESYGYHLSLHLTRQKRCVPVEITQCRKLGYNLTRSIDLYSSAARNIEKGKRFIGLLQHMPCSQYALFFLCSIYSPMCFKGHRDPILPCKSVCHKVKDSCVKVMRSNGIEWLKELDCEVLPEHTSGVCIQPSAFVSSKQGKRLQRIKNSNSKKRPQCKPCKEEEHTQAKFRQYKKADYVIEATIVARKTTAHWRTKVYVNVTTILKQGKIAPRLGRMKLWALTTCLCPKIEFDKKYYILGEENVKKGSLMFDNNLYVLPRDIWHQKVMKWHKKCSKRSACNHE